MNCTFLFIFLFEQVLCEIWSWLKGSVICVHVVFPCHIIINILDLSWKVLSRVFQSLISSYQTSLPHWSWLTHWVLWSCSTCRSIILYPNSENLKMSKTWTFIKHFFLHTSFVFCNKQDSTLDKPTPCRCAVPQVINILSITWWLEVTWSSTKEVLIIINKTECRIVAKVCP